MANATVYVVILRALKSDHISVIDVCQSFEVMDKCLAELKAEPVTPEARCTLAQGRPAIHRDIPGHPGHFVTIEAMEVR